MINDPLYDAPPFVSELEEDDELDAIDDDVLTDDELVGPFEEDNPDELTPEFDTDD